MDTVFIVACIALLLLAVLFCYLRGFKRSLVRLIAVAVSAILALLITKPIVGACVNAINLKNVAFPPIVYKAIEGSLILQNLVKSLPKMILAPVVFPVIFAVLSFLSYIPTTIINRKKTKEQKGKGALIGIVVGLLSFLLAFGPVMGVVTLADKIVSNIPEELKSRLISDEIIDFGITTVNVKKIVENSKFTASAGSVAMPVLNSLSGAKIGNETVSLSREIENMIPLVEAVATLDNDENELNTETLVDQISLLVETAENSGVVREILDTSLEAFAASIVSETMLNDDETMEVIANLVNQVNSGNNEELIRQIKENLDPDKFELPPEAIDYAEKLVQRKYPGSDWTPEQVRSTLADLVTKYK